MTDKDWLACDDPQKMLNVLYQQSRENTQRHYASTKQTLQKFSDIERRLRLFSAACVRRLWPMLTYGRGKKAVEASELFADGLVTEKALQAAEESAGKDALTWKKEWASKSAANREAMLAAWAAAGSRWAGGWTPAQRAAGLAIHHALNARTGDKQQEQQAQCNLLRDIFGNPFRPVALDPAWLSPTVTNLAESIYAGPAFEKMPVLGDALEDAGCDNQDILGHCRQLGEHTRGCWALDKVLGRE